MLTNCLTGRQFRVLKFIANYISDHGYPPSHREIGVALDIRSPNGVAHHLRVLEEKGYLSHEKGKMRTLTLTRTTT